MKVLQRFNLVGLIAFAFLALFLSQSASAQFPDSLALFVVVDDLNPNAAEQAIWARLDNMGFIVEYVGQDYVTDGSTDGMSLVLISATVSSGTVAGNMPGLKDLAVPIINWEPFIYDALGFQAVDGGEFNTTEISLINPDHPLAAGLADGIVTITTAEKGVSYGMPEGDVAIIAVNVNDETQVVLFGYDEGAAMAPDSGNAPARRVGTFLLNDAADALTEDGWTLFDASISWAMSYQETPPDRIQMGQPITSKFNLQNNYPNPFNQSTVITYSIPVQTAVKLIIYDLQGKQVATLVDNFQESGTYSVPFNARSLSSGVYLYKLDSGSEVITKKMMFLK
jgi:hypothetical protein